MIQHDLCGHMDPNSTWGCNHCNYRKHFTAKLGILWALSHPNTASSSDIPRDGYSLDGNVTKRKAVLAPRPGAFHPCMVLGADCDTKALRKLLSPP